MSVEASYYFDEPIGIYGHESHERLAKGVMRDLVRYEETLEDIDTFAKLPYLGVPQTPREEFRIGSIVESSTVRLGYALAVAKPNKSDRAAMGGVFYLVDRDDPNVLEDKGLVVARPETFQSNQDYTDEVEGLMHRFEKSELEAIMRMLGKLTISLDLARELNRINEDEFAILSIAGRMSKEAKIQQTKAALKKSASVEPFVLSALHNHRQNELHVLFPEDRPPQETLDNNQTEHIIEWRDFMGAANDLLSKESDPGSPIAHVNVQYEKDGKIYYIKLAAENGQLFGVQILCDDTGAWQSQAFNLNTMDDEDYTDLNRVSPIWDKYEVVSSLVDGTIISDEEYEYYRLLAENSLQASFSTPDNLIYIQAA